MRNALARLGSTDESRKELYLPVEIITEILSCLPANAVLRFKCVCKLWLSITEDPEFIHKHTTCVREQIWIPKENKEHHIRGFLQGLILEKMDSTSNYRLRNPTTRRVLDLPNPNESHLYHHVLPLYVSSTRTFKVVFPCTNSKDGNGSLKILTLGIDEAWRTLDFPFQCRLSDAKCHTKCIGGIYVLLVVPYSLGRPPAIVFLEDQSEKLWMIDMPRGLVTNKSDIINLLDWAKKPALARRSNDGDELHVWVVEDYKKQKWPVKKIVVDLKPLKDDERDYTPYCWHKKMLWMYGYKDGRYLCFDNVWTRIDRPPHGSGKKGQPSLVDLKGMKSLC